MDWAVAGGIDKLLRYFWSSSLAQGLAWDGYLTRLLRLLEAFGG